VRSHLGNSLVKELRASRQETVECLVRAIEMHDRDTGEHIRRIASLAVFLGSKIGLDREALLLLRAAAPMHDVGKVATPDAILRKPGPLTCAEQQRMQDHTNAGHRILGHSRSDLLQMAARIALTHHEHWDGTGYPDGLRGEEIPIEGRIVAVADVFDALLCDRSYRLGLPIEVVVDVITDGRGSHFDPRVADALLDHVEEVLHLRG
jgi:putative two-component system response regulator